MRPYSLSFKAFGGQLHSGLTDTQAGSVWFTDFEQIRSVLADPKFLAKVLAVLPNKNAADTAESIRPQIFAYPSSIQTANLVDLANIQISDGSDSDDLKDFENSQHEVEKRQSLQLITLSISADSPEKAKALADAVVQQFLAEMRLRASAEFTVKRKAIEDLLRRSQVQIEILRTALSKPAGRLSGAERLDVERELKVELERMQIRRDELQAAQAASNAAIASERDIGIGTKKDIDGTLDQAKVGQTETERTYAPDSAVAKMSREHLERLEKLRSTIGRELRDSKDIADQTSSRSRQVAIAQLSEDIDQVKSALGTSSQLDEAHKLESTLEHWQNNVFNIIPELYRARVEERQAESQGVLILVKKPLLGAALHGSGSGAPPLVGLIALLPVSLGLGFIVVALIEVFHQTRLLSRQIHLLGLPLLAELVELPRSVSRPWQDMKTKVLCRKPSTKESN